MKLKSLLMVGLVIALSACKYEEGPNMSLRSKKARVTGNWYYYEYIEDGKTTAADDYEKELHWEFKKDGAFKLQRSSNPGDEGTWEFDDGKDSLVIKFNAGGRVAYKIIKLKNKEMWLKNKTVSSEVEWHFKPVD